MSYRVCEHDGPEGLLGRAGALLHAREAVHTVMLGALSRLAALPGQQRGEALLATVERDGEVVAAAVRTPPRALLLSAGLPPGAVEALAEHLHARDPGLDRVNGLPAEATAFARSLADLRGGEIRTIMELRLFGCARVRPPARPAPGRMREAEEADAAQLVEWLDAFTAEALPHEPRSRPTSEAVNDLLASGSDGYVLWEDGCPAAMAAYLSVGKGSPRLGAVYTPPGLRARGYASALVAALTQRLLEAGHRQVVLFTDLANPTSSGIYQAIGYRPLADFADIEIKGVQG